jgi:hypothetical protein
VKKKTWTINNGWNRMNLSGQMVLCQVGPSDFDPDYEVRLELGLKPPYRSNGTSYTFARKRDFEAAVEQLRRNGYIA